MTDFLIRLGTLSLGGGVAVLLLIGAGRMSRNRYAARWRCRAWNILCLLMILPIPVFSLPTPIKTPSTLIQLQLPAEHTVSDRPTLENGERQPHPHGNGGYEAGNPTSPTGTASSQNHQYQSTPQASQAPQTPTAPAVRSFSIPALLLALWVAGMAALLIRHLAAHLIFCRWIKRWAEPVTEREIIQAFRQAGDRLGLRRLPGILSCPGLASPMLCGLFRPVLLIPQRETHGEALELTLEHELTHYRRRDVWWKALALLANAAHWFNPLMWWMVRRVEYDLELACDDAVLQTRGQAGRAVYGRTVLEALEALSTQSFKGK